jgi:hypothetical protein
MGLDVTAYNQVKKIADLEDEELEGSALVTVNCSFIEQADGLRNGYYSYVCDFDFRAGSYHGYNIFRGLLAKLIGKTDAEIWAGPVPGPFVELINFADNAGTIGPVTSKKLYKDFADHVDKVRELHDRNWIPDTDTAEYFIETYRRFMKAFELASDGGCVVFH